MLLLSGVCWASGCYQPETSADAPPLDASADPTDAEIPREMGIDGEEADAGPTQQLSFRVTTSPLGGRFLPYNVGAIWVEDAEGGFVETLELWGTTRARYLRRFQEASAGDVVDAVTGATLKTHETHEISWDLRDRMQEPVPEGDYRLLIELTDRNGLGASLEIPFTLSAEPFTDMPADTPQFRDMLLTIDLCVAHSSCSRNATR